MVSWRMDTGNWQGEGGGRLDQTVLGPPSPQEKVSKI